MEIEIAIACSFPASAPCFATIDMAFSQLSDVGWWRLAADYEASPRSKTVAPSCKPLSTARAFALLFLNCHSDFIDNFSVLVTLIVTGFANPPYFNCWRFHRHRFNASPFFRQFRRAFNQKKIPKEDCQAAATVRPVYGVTVADRSDFFIVAKNRQSK